MHTGQQTATQLHLMLMVEQLLLIQKLLLLEMHMVNCLHRQEVDIHLQAGGQL